MKNNRGMTLVELLVSIAIFGIVLAAIFGFMLASAKSYNRVNDRLEIQSQSQIAMNFIEEYAIDCTFAIGFVPGVDNDQGDDGVYSSGTLYIINKGAEPESYTAHVISLGENNTLFYCDGEVTVNADGNIIVTSPNPAKISAQVVGLTARYTATTEDEDDAWYTQHDLSSNTGTPSVPATVTLMPDPETPVASITVAVGLIKRTARYEGVETIALRNRPILLKPYVAGS